MPDEDLKMDYKVVNVRAYPQPQLHRLSPGGPLPGERASYLGMHFLIHSLTPSLCHSRLLTPSLCLSSLPLSLSQEVSNYATALYQISSREDAQEITDTLKLRFALKGFMSPFLERRVVGITDICALIDEVWTCDVPGAKGRQEIDERPWITQGLQPRPVSNHCHYNNVQCGHVTKLLCIPVSKRPRAHC